MLCIKTQAYKYTFLIIFYKGFQSYLRLLHHFGGALCLFSLLLFSEECPQEQSLHILPHTHLFNKIIGSGTHMNTTNDKTFN